jgi:uncharacterized RDD family membrane protein YckC
VTGSAQSSGLLRRAGAMLYDSILLFALLMLATLPFVAVRGGEFVDPSDNAFYQLVLAALIFAYFTGYWAWKGRTLGMQSWGLQLETPGRQAPGFAPCAIRFFAAIVSFAPFGLGFIWQLWDRDGLAWHDRLSGTQLMWYPRQAR